MYNGLVPTKFQFHLSRYSQDQCAYAAVSIENTMLLLLQFDMIEFNFKIVVAVNSLISKLYVSFIVHIF